MDVWTEKRETKGVEDTEEKARRGGGGPPEVSLFLMQPKTREALQHDLPWC